MIGELGAIAADPACALATQRALDAKTPILALKEWQKRRPELFVKRVYDQTGLVNE